MISPNGVVFFRHKADFFEKIARVIRGTVRERYLSVGRRLFLEGLSRNTIGRKLNSVGRNHRMVGLSHSSEGHICKIVGQNRITVGYNRHFLRRIRE